MATGNTNKSMRPLSSKPSQIKVRQQLVNHQRFNFGKSKVNSVSSTQNLNEEDNDDTTKLSQNETAMIYNQSSDLAYVDMVGRGFLRNTRRIDDTDLEEDDKTELQEGSNQQQVDEPPVSNHDPKHLSSRILPE